MIAIPDELSRAADSFRQWALNQWLEAEDEKILGPLYHYTDANGLKGIIETQEIWLTSHRYLKDPSELIFGIEEAQKAIEIVAAERSGYVKVFWDKMAELHKIEYITQELEYLLASFSYDRNNLGQWRAYASNGCGFALGLSPQLFLDDQEIAVSPIRYGRPRARERHYSFIKKAADILEYTVMGREDLMQDEAVTHYVKHVMAFGTLFVCATSKHEAYDNEREVRLLKLGVRTRFNIETRVRNGELVAFVRHRIPLRSGSIVEIVVGPSAGLDAEHAVRSLLNSAHIDPTSVPICRSDIPYRGV